MVTEFHFKFVFVDILFSYIRQMKLARTITHHSNADLNRFSPLCRQVFAFFTFLETSNLRLNAFADSLDSCHGEFQFQTVYIRPNNCIQCSVKYRPRPVVLIRE